jgi:hypothetical protein
MILKVATGKNDVTNRTFSKERAMIPSFSHGIFRFHSKYIEP